uniref:Glycoside hydrolase family 5 domain-containing protein n=1 Tax=Skeletonema marinoi TaxID=267567 RepID=A0A7S1CU88_9STRA|mmetsp:Transcript_1387/g.2025  ORF Transcript_1387/g.2025 Transcript_1387/m.2025 type:complete len:508 (+) Transcript_1387:77-1600(+)
MYSPITAEDTVVVRGKHLYKRDGSIFTIRGVAFPTPPEDDVGVFYNSSAWLDILKQLRELDLQFNTVRLYRMDPLKVDYSEFIEGAAELGVYIIVPLTAASGGGVLDRTLPAPKCYKKSLFNYGANALYQYLKHPNVLGGVVGNEVMNDETSWLAAPCVRSYARNLKLFMDRLVQEKIVQRTLPLIYAAQDSSVLGGAEMDSDTIVKLTADYLTCGETGKGTIVADVAGDEAMTHGMQHFSENRFGMSPIDIFGINIESWCWSRQDYYYNPDGSLGAYFSLWKALQATSVPVIFSEMGCPHQLFDRDDPLHRNVEGTRDWAQVQYVLNEMRDTWSGFIAYTYDGGGNDFNMFTGGPWDGRNVLQPSQDFWNFKEQLDKLENVPPLLQQQDIALPRRCSAVQADFISCCGGLRLFNDDKMQTFGFSAIMPVDVEVNDSIQQTQDGSPSEITKSFYTEISSAGLVLVLFSVLYTIQKWYVSSKLSSLRERSKLRGAGNTNTKYMSIEET